MGNGQSFLGLGDLPGGGRSSRALGISSDGLAVVGGSRSAQSGFQDEAFRWTQSSGMVGLGLMPGFRPFSRANGSSSDGSVVVGAVSAVNGFGAFRWTEQTAMVPIGSLSVGGSEAAGVSGDGTIIVGYAENGGHLEAFRWTEQSGMVSLTPDVHGFAADITTDGRVVVGATSTVGGGYWTEATGWVSIGRGPFGAVPSPAAVNTDGSVIVGSFDLGGVSRAFRWTQQAGIVSLDHLDVGEQAVANAVSGDGRVIVGVSGVRAFIWDAQHGMRDLRRVLTRDYGLDLSQWPDLLTATGISADGRVIVGTGYGPNGQEAWMAVIPEPGAVGGLIGGLGMLAVRRRA